MNYLATTPLSTQSNLNNSLDGVRGAADGDFAYVQSNNAKYTFNATSEETPDGDLVVIQFGLATSVAGRWIRTGAPGTSEIIPGFPMFSVPSGMPYFSITSTPTVTLTGGASFELQTVTYADLVPDLSPSDVVYACIAGNGQSALSVTVNANLLTDGTTVTGVRLLFREMSGNLAAGDYPVRLFVARPQN